MSYITESYSLKYYGECMNYRKQRSRVEIWQKGTLDATYPRRIGDITGLSLSINGNEEVDAPIIKTILNLKMADTWDEPQEAAADAVKHGAWEEFYTPDSTAYLVKLYTREEGDGQWEHRWSGYITPDNWSESISYRGDVGITARDNLGHLKDFTFDLVPDSTGLVSALDIIEGALRKIAFPMDVTIDVEPAGPRATLNDSENGGSVLTARIAASELEGDDWGEVLEDVLDSLGLTIRYTDRNTVTVTHIRNLPYCGFLLDPAPQDIEFYGPGTRTLVPAYRDVVIDTDFDYQRDVDFPAAVDTPYGTSESFDYEYYQERGSQVVRGSALRCEVGQSGLGWFSGGKAFVDPSRYRVTNPRGGGAAIDTETTALLIANATDEAVRQSEAGFAFGRVNTPAGTVSLESETALALSGLFLLRAGTLESLEWSACYVVPESSAVYWWNGSQWKAGSPLWSESTDGKMDFSAPMNLAEIPEWGQLSVFVRNIKATAGFCVAVSGMTLSCVAPSSSLDGDTVTVINNAAYNVRAKRSPRFGFLSRPVSWNVTGNYPNAFWRVATGGRITPFPYQCVWSDGAENLGFPAQWARQTLMFHHVALQQIEGQVGVKDKGMWRFDRPSHYKGHTFLQRGGTWDLLTGHVTGISLREYVPFTVLWEGEASVAPTQVAFPQEGGTASVLVTAADDKEWSVDYLPSWITASPLRGMGSGTVTLTAEPNNGGSRTRTIYVAGKEVRLSQGQMSFDLSVSPDTITAPVDGKSYYVEVQASTGAVWRLVADVDWILVNGLEEWEGTGYNDAVIVGVQENDTGQSRTGTVSLYDGDGAFVQAITVTQPVTAVPLTLTIGANVSSPSVALTVNGTATPYSSGMEVPAGARVTVTVSKSGYTSVSDAFVMSEQTTDRYYTLSPDIPVTFSSPANISSSAQRVSITVSDQGNKGWGIDFDNPQYRGYVTGAGVTSGNATVSGTTITGTGDAVVWLQISANNSTSSRDIGNTSDPFYTKTSAKGSWTANPGLGFTQYGTSSSIISVTSVTLNRSTLSLQAGNSSTLTATVRPSDASNPAVAWSSSDTSVAVVSSSGVVTGVRAGTATIRATATDGSGKYGSCTVTVTAGSVAVTGVTLNKSAASVGVGGSTTLTATVKPSNATNKTVTWSSSNTSVATVDSSGKVTGVSAGTATITVTTSDGGYTATCQVTVSATQVSVTGVRLDKSTLSLGEGKSGRLTATVFPSNATDKGVTWRSTDTSVASVSADGLVIGIAEGSCLVYVKTDDGGYEASCAVTVVPGGSLSAEDTMVKSVATTASAALTAVNMNAATISASASASWIQGITVDTSSTPFRVRLTISANSSSSARSATVTVTGTDLTGVTRTTTFLLTQSGQSSSDIPCTGMTMSGPDTIYNSDNIADYTVEFTPLSTTQNAVDWSVTTRSGGSTSLARISVTGDSRCTVEVLSGASSAQLTVRAVNRYNGQIVATKDITATYIGGSTAEGRIEVSESYIEVGASSTEDDWAQVTLVDMSTPLNQLGVAVSGFITSAAVDSRGRVRVVFPANTSSDSRSGSVTLTGIDASGHSVMAVISYLQSGVETGRYTFEVAALEITGTTRARFAVVYRNDTRADATVTGLRWTLTGYASGGGVTCRANGSLSDKTVAAVSEETDVYSAAIEVTGPTVRYVLTLTSDATAYTYEGDGSDPI